MTKLVENIVHQVANRLSDMILLNSHEAFDGAIDYSSVKIAAHKNVSTV